VPGATPVTVPPDVIVATEVVPLVHTPPVLTSVSVIVEPAHTRVDPDIAEGNELTVTITDAEHPVPMA